MNITIEEQAAEIAALKAELEAYKHDLKVEQAESKTLFAEIVELRKAIEAYKNRKPFAWKSKVFMGLLGISLVQTNTHTIPLFTKPEGSKE